MPESVDWNQLLLALPERKRGQCETFVRRSLKRQMSREAGAAGMDVPASVRSEAVGQWRRMYMKGASKSATRRMNHERLRWERTYQEIERRLLVAYRKHHQPPQVPHLASVDRMTFVEACERYRAMHPKFTESSLINLARELCMTAYRTHAKPDAVCERLADLALSRVRSGSLDGCASVYEQDAVLVGKFHKRPFHLEDLTSEEQVTQRVMDTRLAEGVVAAQCKGKALVNVAADLLVAQAREDADVRALNALLSALYDTTDCVSPLLARIARSDAKAIVRSLQSPTFAQRMTAALLANPVYGAQYQRSVELRLRIRQRVPETPMEAYPLARTMRRHIVLHVGPTNSGKTHDALQALKAAPSGAYLGPLRLLAYEQFERLNREGCPCSLLTGEEAQEVAGAHHVASTVEMADFHTPIDVAVIDEAQMIADQDRGQHWTAAVLGIPAREVHVCCAPHARKVLQRLAYLCDDELELVLHERLVPLLPSTGSFHVPESVEPGDALVVFSRKAVHAVAAEVAAVGLRPSLVYGALPHDVRHEEARRFDEGETDVVVATDAIGMGMNLPIRRIVFMDQMKFDGHELRMLRPEEVQQIAGRAGRFGRFDTGLYQSTRKRKEIAHLYGQAVPAIESIPVGIPENIALVRDASLTDCITRWTTIEQPPPFKRINVQRDLALIAEVEARMSEEERTDIGCKLKALALATMPFDENDRTLRHAWLHMVKAELAGGEAELPVPDEPIAGEKLLTLEADYRYCDLLYTYARTFGHEDRLPLLMERRTQISHVIMDMLAQGGRAGATAREDA